MKSEKEIKEMLDICGKDIPELAHRKLYSHVDRLTYWIKSLEWVLK